MCEYGVREFSGCHVSVTDEQRSGHPSTLADLVPAIEETVPGNRRVLHKELEEQFSLSHGTIWDTVHERSGYRKVCSRWVPRQLTEDHKENCMGASLTHLLHLMIMVSISWSKSLPGMKLGTFISSPTRKNIFVPSNSNHTMMSSMMCKHGCVVRIPPSIDRVLRNGFPA